MPAIADIGALVEVTPQDEIWVETGAEACEHIRDFSPFQMRVAGRTEDNGSLIGVFGPVVGGAPRYHGARGMRCWWSPEFETSRSSI
jgi:hypothetical protein